MRSSQKGFTLAELLIALALLGIIAAFTIPKVLTAASNQEATAKVREAVASLEQAFDADRIGGTIDTSTNLYGNISNQLNTVASSPTATPAVDAANAPYDATTSGSRFATTPHPCTSTNLGATAKNGWVQFANGTVISGLSSVTTSMSNLLWNDPLNPVNRAAGNYILCIDYNGANNPNTAGQDVFIGNFNQFGNFDSAAVPTTEQLKAFRWKSVNGVLSGAGSIMQAGGTTAVAGASGPAGFAQLTSQAGARLSS